MQGQFVIGVRDLEAGARDYAFSLSPSWLEAAVVGCDVHAPPGATGTLEVHAVPTGTDVLLEGTLRTEVVSTCVRCLEPARVPIDTRFAILMVRRAGLDESRFEDGDADWETFDGDQIVLDGLCREQILLEVPMNPLCSPDCPGIPYGSRDPN